MLAGVESEEEQRVRFQVELEFVQCLANPNYLNPELETRLLETSKSLDTTYAGRGKTKKYRDSDLRLLETLENLCERVIDYSVHKEYKDSRRFAKRQSNTMKTLHGLVEKGVQVDLGIPYELWDWPSVEVTRMKMDCEGNDRRMLRSIFQKVRRFDAYSKPLEDCRVRTLSGGAVTVVCVILMVVLFVSQLKSYLSTEIVEELFVDTTVGDEHLKINFDILFPALDCQFISVDAMDIAGQLQSNVTESVWKDAIVDSRTTVEAKPISELSRAQSTTPSTTTCGSCYGAEIEPKMCCNTCDDVKRAYLLKGWVLGELDKIVQCRDEEWVRKLRNSRGVGCRVHGWLEVSKVAGNFHIAPGSTVKDLHSHVHNLHAVGPKSFNTSHIVRHFSFGTPYPGKQYPLDGQQTITESGGVMVHYFVKIVPTVYVDAQKDRILTHQFSVTKHQQTIGAADSAGLPGFFVSYEFSPLMVQLSHRDKPFAHFIAKVCALIGGLFTVASILDSCFYRMSNLMTASSFRIRKEN
ncbi:Endoplasmic reticulum-Golgi intermediate compartm ent protein 3 [Trichuris trichiura]|uniref:Endoplasmic reticulum-Golgi intermediate compartment protein 3 n=1 Tax=Trichuris trichiura TaxID=36087 RepID=A0A077ZAF5_TRITR|nr:Endoplasmic reticulum-Golgi intermediate compartm ent protein 3 [Trichuris trichiura]